MKRTNVCPAGHTYVLGDGCNVCRSIAEKARRREIKEALAPLVRKKIPPAQSPVSPYALTHEQYMAEMKASRRRQAKRLKAYLKVRKPEPEVHVWSNRKKRKAA